MAIQYITNALGASNSTTSFSISLPATEAGDILILEFTHRGTGDGTIGGTSVTTGGLTWTKKHNQPYATSTFAGLTYWTRATGNHSGQTVTGSSLINSCAAIVTQYRGCVATGDPLADATIVGEQNASGDEGQAAITTATNGAYVVLVVVNSPDLAVTSMAAANLTLEARAERLSTGGTDTSIAHASGELAAPGSSGSFTWSQTNAASGSWAYAIRPAVTTAPTVGTVRTVGQTPTVRQTWSAAPSVGTLRFDGQQPTVSAGVVNTDVSPLVGTLRITGQTPTVALVNSWIALVPGINTWAPRYQIGGTDESPSTGTLRFVGQEPTVTIGGADVSVSPTVGALVITGQQPVVAQTWSAAPQAGTLRLIGQQPDLDQTWSAAPQAGTLRLIGQQSAIDQTWSASPTVGTLRLVGEQPTVTLTQNLWASPTAGTLRVTGQQPSVAQTFSAAPTAGVLRLAGQQPTISTGDNRVSQPSSGTLRIEGLTPTVAQTWSATPTVGTVRLVGQAPEVDQTWSASPSAGALRFAGQQPTVSLNEGTQISPTAGALRFDGQQPTVEQAGSWTVAPSAGVLRFVGNAPQILVPGIDVEAEPPSGGWAAYNQSTLDRAERIRREIQDERERQELADRLEAELRREGVLADSDAERLRLAALAAQYQDAELPNRVARALRYAQRAESDLAIELALREFRRMQEEEELAVLMALVLD